MYSLLRSTAFGFAALATSSSLLAFGFPSDYGSVSRQQAFADAPSNGKPIAVYYSLSYCPGCRILEGQFRKDTVYSNWTGNFNFVSLDPGATRSHKQRTEQDARWGVVVTPTLIFFAPTGEYICFRRGAFNTTDEAAAFPARLRQYLKAQNTSSSPRDCAELTTK